MHINFTKIIILSLFIHISLSIFYLLIFEKQNDDIKKINFIITNEKNIKNIIIGDSTGVFGFSNSILMNYNTFNNSMYAENIICAYYKLKYIKEKIDNEFNIYLNAQDYIFNRKNFCNNGIFLRRNIIKLEDYIDYFQTTNQLSLSVIKKKYLFDKFYTSFYLDIYNLNNLKLISRTIEEYIYNLFSVEKRRFIKRLDQNLDQYSLYNVERENYNSLNAYMTSHKLEDQSYKLQKFDVLVYKYVDKIAKLFPNKKIYSYIMPHYKWNRKQIFNRNLNNISTYESNYNFIDLFNDNINYFYNSSHLNKNGSIIFSKYFIDKLMNDTKN